MLRLFPEIPSDIPQKNINFPGILSEIYHAMSSEIHLDNSFENYPEIPSNISLRIPPGIPLRIYIKKSV